LFVLKRYIRIESLFTHLQEIRGSFDEAGQLELSTKAYWDLLEAQLEKHTQVKHVSGLPLLSIKLSCRCSCDVTVHMITGFW
jgi:hypothetical protein